MDWRSRERGDDSVGPGFLTAQRPDLCGFFVRGNAPSKLASGKCSIQLVFCFVSVKEIGSFLRQRVERVVLERHGVLQPAYNGIGFYQPRHPQNQLTSGDVGTKHVHCVEGCGTIVPSGLYGYAMSLI